MKTSSRAAQSIALDPPPCARSVLMRSDYCPVDDGADLIVFELKLLEDKLPHASVCPVGEAIVDRLPRAEPFGEIAPGNAGLCAVKDRVDELSIADLRFGALATVRKNGSQPGPLLITQRMSVHRKLGSHSGSERNFFSKI